MLTFTVEELIRFLSNWTMTFFEGAKRSGDIVFSRYYSFFKRPVLVREHQVESLYVMVQNRDSSDNKKPSFSRFAKWEFGGFIIDSKTIYMASKPVKALLQSSDFIDDMDVFEKLDSIRIPLFRKNIPADPAMFQDKDAVDKAVRNACSAFLFGTRCNEFSNLIRTMYPLNDDDVVVDHEKTYAESYEFLRLFDVTSAYTGPHSAMGEMTKTLWDYLEQKTILDPDYLNTPELQNEAYENAVKQYVLQKKDTAFEEDLREFLEHIDDTATIEFFANPTGWAERVVDVLDKNLTSHDGTPFSKSIGKKFVAVQRLTQLRMLEFQSKPHCWESECRSLFAATEKAKNIRLVIEANGKEMQVQYPVSNLITSETIKNKVISTWAIAPRKLCNDVEEFLVENCADYSKYQSDIPMKAVSRIESGRKVLWENPIFEETKK